MTETTTAQATADARTQYLTFRVGDEEFGIEIMQVQEIRGWSGATTLPHAPPHLLGVINLRGSVVPVIDLRRRFGRVDAAFGPTTVCIVVRVETDRGHTVAGFVVDAVCEVYDVAPAERKAVPDGVTGRREYVQGLATVDDKMVILLDIERLYAETDVSERIAHAA